MAIWHRLCKSRVISRKLQVPIHFSRTLFNTVKRAIPLNTLYDTKDDRKHQNANEKKRWDFQIFKVVLWIFFIEIVMRGLGMFLLRWRDLSSWTATGFLDSHWTGPGFLDSHWTGLARSGQVLDTWTATGKVWIWTRWQTWHVMGPYTSIPQNNDRILQHFV